MNKKLQSLRESLLHFKVAELRALCKKYQLISIDKKLELIHRLIHFVETGNRLNKRPIPKESKGIPGERPLLLPEQLMLHGIYKNDAKTRVFMKSLIGPHFHFTAHTIDWINERWQKGAPPTYREFADEWIKQSRSPKPTPKDEWAYINFTQNFLKKHPDASKKELIEAWNDKRKVQVALGLALIDQLITERPS